jgi:hypothetical protein
VKREKKAAGNGRFFVPFRKPEVLALCGQVWYSTGQIDGIRRIVSLPPIPIISPV